MNQQPQPNQPWQNPYAPPVPPQQPPQSPYPSNMPPQGYQYPPEPPRSWPPALRVFSAGRPEIGFAAMMAVFGIFLLNCIIFAGFQLGFAMGAVGIIASSWVYLVCTGHRPGWYDTALAVLSVVIAAGFARSDDAFVKFVMLAFLTTAVNLSLCLLAGQNRRDPGGIRSLLDAPRTVWILGLGELGPAVRGLKEAGRRSGTAGKRGGAVLLGLIIALPLVAVMVFLLMRADAAFEGLMDMLPQASWREPIVSVITGGFAALLLYTRGVALVQKEKPAAAAPGIHRMNPLTVNTILGAVALVYVAYLVSQLAYFTGSFAGILPEGYTMAEYARRGFFEMAWLCAINLSIIWFAIGLVRKDPKAPLTVRLLCLFIGLITVFLVVVSSSKMLMYIDSYGLTRLRLLTEVIIVFLGLTTALVCLWLFVPKMPYMKAIVLLGLAMGAGVFWADVDTQVARYNVQAYYSGALETVDVDYLSTLSSGAVPYLKQLARDPDLSVAVRAMEALEHRRDDEIEDFRDWTYAEAQANKAAPATDLHPDHKNAITDFVCYYMEELDVFAGEFSKMENRADEAAMQASFRQTFGIETPVTRVSLAVEGSIDFSCGGWENEAGSGDTGFLYIPGDVPNFDITQGQTLTEVSDGVYFWRDGDGSHQVYVERIFTNWFYYAIA